MHVLVSWVDRSTLGEDRLFQPYCIRLTLTWWFDSCETVRSSGNHSRVFPRLPGPDPIIHPSSILDASIPLTSVINLIVYSVPPLVDRKRVWLIGSRYIQVPRYGEEGKGSFPALSGSFLFLLVSLANRTGWKTPHMILYTLYRCTNAPIIGID